MSVVVSDSFLTNSCWEAINDFLDICSLCNQLSCCAFVLVSFVEVMKLCVLYAASK